MILELELSEMYSEPSQTSKMKLFTKTVNSLQPFITFAIPSNSNVWQSSEYASGHEYGLSYEYGLI